MGQILISWCRATTTQFNKLTINGCGTAPCYLVVMKNHLYFNLNVYEHPLLVKQGSWTNALHLGYVTLAFKTHSCIQLILFPKNMKKHESREPLSMEETYVSLKILCFVNIFAWAVCMRQHSKLKGPLYSWEHNDMITHSLFLVLLYCWVPAF